MARISLHGTRNSKGESNIQIIGGSRSGIRNIGGEIDMSNVDVLGPAVVNHPGGNLNLDESIVRGGLINSGNAWVRRTEIIANKWVELPNWKKMLINFILAIISGVISGILTDLIIRA